MLRRKILCAILQWETFVVPSSLRMTVGIEVESWNSSLIMMDIQFKVIREV